MRIRAFAFLTGFVLVATASTALAPAAIAAKGGQTRVPATLNLVASADVTYWSLWNRYDNLYYETPIEPDWYRKDGVGFTFDTATRMGASAQEAFFGSMPDPLEPVSDDPSALFRGAYLGAVTEAFGLTDGTDLTGNRLAASVHLVIRGGTPVFLYPADEAGAEPDITPNACGGPVTVALYFESWSEAVDDAYWYADQSIPSAAWATLDDVWAGGSLVTLKALLRPEYWIDTDGVSAVDVPDAFAAAVASVSWIGVTIGGGCYSATGVALETDGASGQLHLARLAIQR